jgi:hypothetical protein
LHETGGWIQPPADQMQHGRRIPSIDELLLLPISLQSRLTRPEGFCIFSAFSCLLVAGIHAFSN